MSSVVGEERGQGSGSGGRGRRGQGVRSGGQDPVQALQWTSGHHLDGWLPARLSAQAHAQPAAPAAACTRHAGAALQRLAAGGAPGLMPTLPMWGYVKATNWPLYEGSVRISWYPVRLVLNTTSPTASRGAQAAGEARGSRHLWASSHAQRGLGGGGARGEHVQAPKGATTNGRNRPNGRTLGAGVAKGVTVPDGAVLQHQPAEKGSHRRLEQAAAAAAVPLRQVMAGLPRAPNSPQHSPGGRATLPGRLGAAGDRKGLLAGCPRRRRPQQQGSLRPVAARWQAAANEGRLQARGRGLASARGRRPK